MYNLFRSEWIKVAGNRWVAGCLIWIFPVAVCAFLIVAALVVALSGTARQGLREDETILWTDQAISAWSIPNNPVGRLILLAFTAVVFAGEYQWGTWKNVVPRNRRTALIGIKFVTVGAFVVFSFMLTSVLLTAGWGMISQMAGLPYGPEITRDVLVDFSGDYALAAGLAFTTTIIGAGYAALAAMVTRSILGGVLASFGVTFFEYLTLPALMLIGWLLDIVRIVHLYRFTPGYNLINVATWITEHEPERMQLSEEGDFASIIFSDSLLFSVAVLAAWVVGLVALTTYLFRRQDITS